MLSQQELVQNLKERLRIVSTQSPTRLISSSNRSLDRLLGGGWHPGTLVEFFSTGGSGATSLALLAARELCGSRAKVLNEHTTRNLSKNGVLKSGALKGAAAKETAAPRAAARNRRTYQTRAHQTSASDGYEQSDSHEPRQAERALVVIDSKRRFYPPAAAAWQIDLENLLVVCPASVREHHWALHQTLSCPAVGAVLCWPERLDGRMFRRLQLAAETSGSVALLVRPAEARGKPSWAQVQLWVEAVPSEAARAGSTASAATTSDILPGAGRQRIRIELLRLRGSGSGSSVELEIDERGTLHETNTLPLVSELAPATTWQRSAGA